ncbi:hypothetical protein [Pararhizobium sp.]|uniref:hypothetical protein n=1 Tax=Pararhizobium sp. TaxID=1977563 RepID=UPI00271587D6|nr:hypothetical protein [Pararhizobium sp.]MDO9416219.1 hypothetical protein [Pararhizobium sp.]
MNLDPVDQRHLSIHEAGHAVVGRALGMACGHVTIVKDDDSAGHSITDDPYFILQAWEDAGRYRDFSSVMTGRIMAYMAGAEAETVILGFSRGGDGDDREQAMLMAEDMGKDETFLSRARRQTRRVVRRHRAAIEAVAAELLASGTLQALEVDRLFEQHCDR